MLEKELRVCILFCRQKWMLLALLGGGLFFQNTVVCNLRSVCCWGWILSWSLNQPLACNAPASASSWVNADTVSICYHTQIFFFFLNLRTCWDFDYCAFHYPRYHMACAAGSESLGAGGTGLRVSWTWQELMWVLGSFLLECKTSLKDPTFQLWDPTQDLYFRPLSFPLWAVGGISYSQVGLELVIFYLLGMWVSDVGARIHDLQVRILSAVPHPQPRLWCLWVYLFIYFSSWAKPFVRFFCSFKVHCVFGRVVTFESYAASQVSSASCTPWGTVPGNLVLGLLSCYRIFLGGVVYGAGDWLGSTGL